ncbi:MAG: hypothetical protein V4457_05735 [Pseudomonadota bacterium]
MSEPAPFDRWSADLESVLRRYLLATPIPEADHSALLMGVALALAPRGATTLAQALAILVEGVGDWLNVHHRAPQSMPPIHRGPMLSPSLEPLPLKTLWQTRHGLPHQDPGGRSGAGRETTP